MVQLLVQSNLRKLMIYIWMWQIFATSLLYYGECVNRVKESKDKLSKAKQS